MTKTSWQLLLIYQIAILFLLNSGRLFAQSPTSHHKIPCNECHQSVPQKGVQPKIKRTCKSCHSQQPHITVPEQTQENCSQCHSPHGTADTIHSLEKKFILSQPSEVNPHKDKNSCTRCHKTQPIANKTVDFLYEGNFTVLCTSCHWTKSFMHPIQVTIPKNLQKPKDLPLSADKKITCQTCHDSCTKHQVKEPGFIRLLPKYKIRNDLCFDCHNRKKYAKINPHNERNNSEKCLYCHDHDVRLSYKALGKKKVLKTDEFLICLRCHTEKRLPKFKTHSFHQALLPVKLIVPSSFPLDAQGRFTCSTCHNPHFWEGSKISLRGDLPKENFCQNCHPDL